MQTATEERIPSAGVPPQRVGSSSSLAESERLRFQLRHGRASVRLLFAGAPTQSDIDKLIALLELSKDGFPKSDDDGGHE